MNFKGMEMFFHENISTINSTFSLFLSECSSFCLVSLNRPCKLLFIRQSFELQTCMDTKQCNYC